MCSYGILKWKTDKSWWLNRTSCVQYELVVCYVLRMMTHVANIARLYNLMWPAFWGLNLLINPICSFILKQTDSIYCIFIPPVILCCSHSRRVTEMCDMVHNTSPSSEIVLCEVLLRNIDTRRGYLEIWIKLLEKTLENKRS